MKIDYMKITKLMDSADMKYHIFRDRELIVSYQFINGFVITTRYIEDSSELFNLEYGLMICEHNVINQIIEYEKCTMSLRMSAVNDRN